MRSSAPHRRTDVRTENPLDPAVPVPSLGTMAADGGVVAGVAAGVVAADVERELEVYRRELTGYCYRMLGSGGEAEDAVQETMVKAWRAYDRFEGRSSLRSWLFRIATNVCIDMLRSPQRRARPMDLGPVSRSRRRCSRTQPEASLGAADRRRAR
jgi:RNA polymerase sigma-70 factor, ECF subfamily